VSKAVDATVKWHWSHLQLLITRDAPYTIIDAKLN
jgi:hypothetical protein